MKTNLLTFVRDLYHSGAPLLQYMALADVERWLGNQEWEKVRFLLRQVPLDIVPAESEFLYVRAHIHWAAGKLDAAKNEFEKAKYYYRIGTGDLERAALCCLEIADIAHSRGAYAEAAHYVDEAHALLGNLDVKNTHVLAREYLIRAILAPFMGTHQESMQYARMAINLFRQVGDVVTEFMCTIAIASAAFMIGNFVEATARLEAAKRLFATGSVPTIYYSRILNTELHLYWYEGNFVQARALGEQLFSFATLHDTAHQHQQVYAAMLLGNIQRAQGNFALAAESYHRTRSIATSIGFTAYEPWISLHEAWLWVLDKDYKRARAILDSALDQAVVSQWMSMRVVIAVLDMFEGDASSAEPLLATALVYFMERGDEIAVCALHFYLAYCNLSSGNHDTSTKYLNLAFKWLTDRNLCYYPHWWHPQIMAQICAYAVIHCPIYLFTIRRMCVNHIGVEAVPFLSAALKNVDGVAKQQIFEILDEIQQSHLSELDKVADLHIRQILVELVSTGKLVRQTLPALMEKLITAEKRGYENPLIVAVFGLLVHGHARAEIAQRLQCSKNLVKAYVGQIYVKFGLPHSANTKYSERKKRLREAAQAEGFI